MPNMIKVGERLPDAAFTAMGPTGPEVKSTADVFNGRSVALFALPGAYTPVCHRQHLPGIVALGDVLRSQGIDTIACTAVNDVFVLDHWIHEHDPNGKVLMLADGNAEFALKTGLAVDLSRFGLGIRSNRYVMLVADGAVRILSVEDSLMSHDKSSAKTLCSLMEPSGEPKSRSALNTEPVG
jgi:glutaredoxin/glutathione-dependent peroxiredoxin